MQTAKKTDLVAAGAECSIILTEEPARRGFLRSLLVAPALALATHRLILPGESSPRERAKRAWSQFSAAMDEITIAEGEHGWTIRNATNRQRFRQLEESTYLDLRAINYTVDRNGVDIHEEHRRLAI